jgi:DNA-binding NarL/FixJ family response regulator
MSNYFLFQFPSDSAPRVVPVGFVFSVAEHKVLSLLCEGKTNVEIGLLLCRSEWTIKNHVANMLRTSGAKNRHELAVTYFKTQSSK